MNTKNTKNAMMTIGATLARAIGFAFATAGMAAVMVATFMTEAEVAAVVRAAKAVIQ